MPVTIKDVAKAAGVSHTTVSRALRNHPAISEKTSQKVKQVADEMGYYPSAMARGLKTNRSMSIGVVIPHINSHRCSEMLQGINDYLQQEGYILLLATSNHDDNRAEEAVRALSARHVDAIIFCSEDQDDNILTQLEKLTIPHLFINQSILIQDKTIYQVGWQQAKFVLDRL